MKYAVVFEKAPKNYAAYVPDLPGCIATGRSKADVERNIKEAIAFHIDGLKAESVPIPAPEAWTELIEA